MTFAGMFYATIFHGQTHARQVIDIDGKIGALFPELNVTFLRINLIL